METVNVVTFYSPGTFVSEMSDVPIDSWDIEKAKELARGIKERHNATPYGFRFRKRTLSVTGQAVDTETSCFYWLGGQVLTLQEVKDLNDPKHKILISNMECNNIAKIVINDNSWRFTGPLEEGDVVLEWNSCA